MASASLPHQGKESGVADQLPQQVSFGAEVDAGATERVPQSQITAKRVNAVLAATTAALIAVVTWLGLDRRAAVEGLSVRGFLREKIGLGYAERNALGETDLQSSIDMREDPKFDDHERAIRLKVPAYAEKTLGIPMKPSPKINLAETEGTIRARLKAFYPVLEEPVVEKIVGDVMDALTRQLAAKEGEIVMPSSFVQEATQHLVASYKDAGKEKKMRDPHFRLNADFLENETDQVSLHLALMQPLRSMNTAYLRGREEQERAAAKKGKNDSGDLSAAVAPR